MAATPKTGVVMFKGLQSGQTYMKSIYNADTVGGNVLCRIDNGGGAPGAAGGADFCVFGEPVAFIGGSFVTGIVETTQLRLMADYNPTPYCIDWASSVNSLANRPSFNVGFKAGTRISFMQVL
jgi:hypothetical protein